MAGTYTITYTDTVNGTISSQFTLTDVQAASFVSGLLATVPSNPTISQFLHTVQSAHWNNLLAAANAHYANAAAAAAIAQVVPISATVAVSG